MIENSIYKTNILSEKELQTITGGYSRKGAITAIASGAMEGAAGTWELGWGVVGGISIGAAAGGIGYIISGS
ncbi:hypothetical protein C122C_1160 [Leuconostoc gelidum subsp. gasicomitatum]|uniref:Bacteriocin n=1 Tax=Leuconostoc gasicomitatum TaxID=115778 RepID=A0ABP2B5L6_9LACO|nr:bacteriocin [Leuconostoc gasicomitatum]CUW05349.1 hypothetical protein C122C_1160 [Leuconostoc gasicomitatum]CUW10576.1 hypothetical protein PB1E_1212 [Leuconostoc gasicomitatum]